MANGTNQLKHGRPQSAPGITGITVGGYKSLRDEQHIEIRPLTILAGANSSGKSSIMQPLLLFKQTLEAAYDPGTLLLNGPNVKFTSRDQLLTRLGDNQQADTFHAGLRIDPLTSMIPYFSGKADTGFQIEKMLYLDSELKRHVLRPTMARKSLLALIQKEYPDVLEMLDSVEHGVLEPVVTSKRCFLNITVRVVSAIDGSLITELPLPLTSAVETCITEIIHLPGLRGIPERTYPVTVTGPTFPGTFEYYVASIIAQWQTEQATDKLRTLRDQLAQLRLTGRVSARRMNDAQVEIQVGRLPDSDDAGGMVNIADVGLGVSQALPVLVALLVAQPGQMVYLEQPEIHLHPRAQIGLAQALGAAARRGVHVVVETHSELLLLGVQTLVATGQLDPGRVKLHWFTRAPDGATIINSTDLDEAGAFGDWPEDFAAVAREAESRYLDAAEARLLPR